MVGRPGPSTMSRMWGLAEDQRLEQVLQGVVGQQGDRQHGERDAEAVGAEGDQHREGPGEERPVEGDVLVTKLRRAIGRTRGSPSAAAPRAVTARFISPMMVTPRAELRNEWTVSDTICWPTPGGRPSTAAIRSEGASVVGVQSFIRYSRRTGRGG